MDIEEKNYLFWFLNRFQSSLCKAYDAPRHFIEPEKVI